MKISVNYGKKAIAVPGALTDLLAEASGEQIKFLIAVLASDEYLAGGEISEEELCRRAGITREACAGAFGYWKGKGVIEGEAVPAVTVRERTAENGNRVTVIAGGDIPHYTGKEIEELLNGNPSLAGLIDECQKICEKMFVPQEVNKIIALSEYLGLDHEFILLLAPYCKRIGKATVYYIEKTAYGIYNDGVTTLPELERYISDREKEEDMLSMIRRVFGMEKRALSTNEKKFAEEWAKIGFSEEMLTAAYDIAVDNLGKPKFNYINKVLSNWHDAGLTNMEMVREAAAKGKETKSGGREKSYDADEFFEAALRRSLEKMESKA